MTNQAIGAPLSVEALVLVADAGPRVLEEVDALDHPRAHDAVAVDHPSLGLAQALPGTAKQPRRDAQVPDLVEGRGVADRADLARWQAELLGDPLGQCR